MISGARVAERLKASGLSQGELARRVGVSQPTIFKIIHGNKSGSRVLHLVARELGTTSAYLTCETDDPEAEAPENSLSSDEREWIDMLRGLEPRDRQAVLQLTRSLATSARTASVHD